jgi:hypothetical protein
MGGYLFQIVDEVERPIAFFVVALSESQLRWSTIQKEPTASFEVVLNALIRDMKFILRTDHKTFFSLPRILINDYPVVYGFART